MHRKSLDSHGLVVGTIDGEIEAGVVIEDGDAQDKPLPHYSDDHSLHRQNLFGEKGSRGRKSIVLEEESEGRRRSSRIIAQRERENGSKEILERQNNYSANNENRNDGKEKETTTTDVDDHSMPHCGDTEQHSPAKKKGRKYKALNQLMISSSTQPMLQEGQIHPESGSTSQTNVSSLNVMPEKHVLEYVLDVLQRNDPEEFFAKPVSPNVEDYYRIVKKPVHFSTMRAKVHENMYGSLEEFKLDVYLLCANAMNANPANSRRYKVAEAIQSHSKRVFEDLSAAGLQRFQLESFPSKRPPVAPSTQGGQPRSTGHARFRRKPSDTDTDTHCTAIAEIENKDKDLHSNDQSLSTQVLSAPNPNFQLNNNAGNYNNSLQQRHIVELGPASQNVATKTPEDLNLRQFLNGETWRQRLTNVADTVETPIPNLLPNVPETRIDHETPPTDATRRHETEQHVQHFNNASGIQPTPQASVNIRGDASKGQKNPLVQQEWFAYAAYLLSDFFSKYNHEKRESNMKNDQNPNLNPNLPGTINNSIWGPSKDKMVLVSPNANVPFLQEPSQHQNRVLQIGGSIGGSSRQYNTSSTAMIPHFQNNKHVASSSSGSMYHIGESSSHMQVLPKLDQLPSMSKLSLVSQPMQPQHPMSSFSDPRSAPIHSHSQAANFSRGAYPNKSLYGLDRSVVSDRTTSHSHQLGGFQAMLSPITTTNHFSQTHQQVVNQATQTQPREMFHCYTDLQVKLGLLNPMGPFPMPEPKSPSPPPQLLFPPGSSDMMRSNMDQPEWREKEKEGKGSALLPSDDDDDDDDQELNLDLQL